MEDEWTEVKQKKKKQKPRQQQEGSQFGGKGAKGMLVAGPVKQSKYGGAGAWGGSAQNEPETINQASAIADYDFNIDNDEEVKIELVSHTCAKAVQQARLQANMTQAQLAKKVIEDVRTITDVENGTARYNADLINRIEKALGTQIPRGRKKRR